MCEATPLRLIKSAPYCSHKTGVAAVVAGRANDTIEWGGGGATRFACSPGTDDVTAHLHKHRLLLHLISRENTSTCRRKESRRDGLMD